MAKVSECHSQVGDIEVGTFQSHAVSFVSANTYRSQVCSFTSATTGILDPADVNRPDGLFSTKGFAIRDRASRAIAAAYDEGTAAAKNAIGGGAQDPNAPWRDLSSPGTADCWVRTVRTPKPARTTILCNVKSISQTPRLVLLSVDQVQSTVAGSLLLMTDLESWPSFLPMCQSVTVLERYGPDEALSRIEFKLGVGLRTESIMYTSLVDKLEEEGCLEFRACTPLGAIVKKCDKEYAAETGDLGEVPEPSFKLGVDQDFDTCWGTKVPKAGRFTMRGEVDCAALRLYPTGDGMQEYALLQQAEEMCPMDSIVNQIWKTLSRNLMGIVVKQVNKQKPLKVSAERLDYFTGLERQIAAAGERASGIASAA